MFIAVSHFHNRFLWLIYILTNVSILDNCLNQLQLIYSFLWSQSTLTSTIRRLGEETFKGVAYHPGEESMMEDRPRSVAFFKSNNFPLRFVSTLVLLKTVTQGKVYYTQASIFLHREQIGLTSGLNGEVSRGYWWGAAGEAGLIECTGISLAATASNLTHNDSFCAYLMIWFRGKCSINWAIFVILVWTSTTSKPQLLLCSCWWGSSRKRLRRPALHRYTLLAFYCARPQSSIVRVNLSLLVIPHIPQIIF